MPQQQRIIRSHLLSFSFVLITLIIVCPFPSPFFLICMYVHLLLFIVCPFPSPSFLICTYCYSYCVYDNNNRGYIGCIVVAPHYVILC